MKPTSDTVREVLEDERYSSGVRAFMREWVESDFQFNAWFLHVAKAEFDDDQLMEVLGMHEPSYTDVENAVQRYLATPQPENEERMRTAMKESMRLHRASIGDWTPRKD